MMLSLHINVQSGEWIYIKCSNIVDQKFSWIQKIQKKTEIKKPNNGEVILPFLMFSQPAECRGVGNRAILRPPLTFSATLYRFSMEALWELRVLSTQPTTLRCQYVEVYTTTARPQRTSAKLLLSIILDFYSGLLNKYITTNQQTPVRIVFNFVWGNISRTYFVSLILRISFLKVCGHGLHHIHLYPMLGGQRRGAGG